MYITSHRVSHDLCGGSVLIRYFIASITNLKKLLVDYDPYHIKTKILNFSFLSTLTKNAKIRGN